MERDSQRRANWFSLAFPQRSWVHGQPLCTGVLGVACSGAEGGRWVMVSWGPWRVETKLASRGYRSYTLAQECAQTECATLSSLCSISCLVVPFRCACRCRRYRERASTKSSAQPSGLPHTHCARHCIGCCAVLYCVPAAAFIASHTAQCSAVQCSALLCSAVLCGGITLTTIIESVPSISRMTASRLTK